MTTIPDEELDYHYSPSKWSCRMGPEEVIKAHLDTMATDSRNAQWTLDCESGIKYGETEKQKLDVYHKKGVSAAGQPMVMYIHGGYWQVKEIGREISSFMAGPLCNTGASVVALGYDLAPDVSMDTIILQVKKAVQTVLQIAKENHSRGVYLIGHSAGAHLASMMLMSSFSEHDAFDSELIKGAVLVSGVYDLQPLTKTSTNDALGLTDEDARRFSPLSFVPEIASKSRNRHVVLAVGEYDPPEFRRQSGEMEQKLRENGVKTSFLDVPDTDHFNVIEKLSEPNYVLTKETLRLMAL